MPKAIAKSTSSRRALLAAPAAVALAGLAPAPVLAASAAPATADELAALTFAADPALTATVHQAIGTLAEWQERARADRITLRAVGFAFRLSDAETAEGIRARGVDDAMVAVDLFHELRDRYRAWAELAADAACRVLAAGSRVARERGEV